MGPDLLAYPVLGEGQEEVEVYLPDHPGGWYDFHTGTHHEARSRFRRPVGLETLPLFVRAGTVLPLGPVRASTTELVRELTLRIYPRRGTFASTVYEDAGDGWQHMRAEGRRHLHLRCAWNGERLTVVPEVEGGYASERTGWHVEVLGMPSGPRAVLAEGHAVPFACDGPVLRFSIPPDTAFSAELGAICVASPHKGRRGVRT